jgi:hypothetical protein
VCSSPKTCSYKIVVPFSDSSGCTRGYRQVQKPPRLASPINVVTRSLLNNTLALWSLCNTIINPEHVAFMPYSCAGSCVFVLTWPGSLNCLVKCARTSRTQLLRSRAQHWQGNSSTRAGRALYNESVDLYKAAYYYRVLHEHDALADAISCQMLRTRRLSRG